MSSKAPVPEFNFIQNIKLKLLGISKWDIPTYTTNDELFVLYKLARKIKNGGYGVEIGSYIGASSLMIAKGLKSNSKLFCIDTWNNDAMTEGNWDSLKIFQENTKTVENKIITIRETSIIAGNSFNEPIDFLFIDGDHSYEGVKLDVDTWFPKLISGGIIVMHDIGWAEGVIKTIDEDILPYTINHKKLPNLFWAWKK